MSKLISSSDFGEPDPYFRNKAAEGRSLRDMLQNLRSGVETIEISPYLHPDVEEYVYRVLNIYLHGWFYYPLFSIAENLSIFNLEQALKLRYEFQTGPRTTLNVLLKDASNNGLLRFEQTEAVKGIYEARKEKLPLFEEMGFPVQKPDISDIAENRKKLITKNLPIIRGHIAHPTIAGVTMPHSALTGIRQQIEYMNIIATNSDSKLRNYLNRVGINWDNISYLHSGNASSSFSRQAIFANRHSITTEEIEHFLNEVVSFLGLEDRATTDQLWVLSRYTLVPTKAYKLLDSVFRMKPDNDNYTFFNSVDLAEIAEFEDYCITQLKNIETCFNLESQGQGKVQFEMIPTSKGRKQWRVSVHSGDDTQKCFVKRNEYSYHILSKLGLQSKQDNSVHRYLGILRKVIGGRALEPSE